MSYQTLTPEGARALLDGGDGWIYLDVRTVEEFEAGHVPGAYNIPYMFRDPATGPRPNAAFVEQVKKHFSKGTKLVLGCAAGIRSMHSCDLLEAGGFTKLANMDGGYSGRREPSGQMVQEGWASHGYPSTLDPEEGRTYAALS